MLNRVAGLGVELCTAGHIALVSASPVICVDGWLMQRAKNMISDIQE